ncbi:MAG: YceI family protein [Chloroflexi bacterium]|nr:YceI family protein [Chloroflexota bacterium]
MTTSVPTRTSTQWAIDAAHSLAEFSVKHMMVATVKGSFGAVNGTITLDESNHEATAVDATIDVATINTGVEQRDAHLRSADFFDAEQYPQISFRSTRVEPKGEDRARVYGDLTIHSVTQQVALDVDYEGQIKDAYGQQRAAFTATAEISRGTYGLTWNAALEAGGVAVSDKVKVTLHIAAVRQD